jgi:type IX secretion system PorP/SprF family membrane protein
VLLLATALLLSHSHIRAQDIHFSQFFVSPLNLNPATTGKFNGSFRAAGNYRNQWPSVNKAFTTATVSIDAPVLRNKLAETDIFGLGFTALTDISGNGLFTKNSFSFSTAYHRGLAADGKQFISAGFQLAYTTHRFDLTKALFADQLNGTGITSTQERFNQNNINIRYADVSAGLMYSSMISDNGFFYGGASYYHITKPTETFKEGSFSLSQRLAVHAGGYWMLNDRTTFHTNNQLQLQGTTNELLAGGAIEWMLNDDNPEKPTSFYVGLWGRFNSGVRSGADAVFPYTGLEFGNFRLGFSYDINVSALRAASQSRGGAEISLIYIANKQSGNNNHKKYWCPKF